MRDLGIGIGRYPTGPRNSITDVAGVRVGHSTIIRGDAGPLRVGEGPVRTGVTAVIPHPGDTWERPCFAGFFALNGSGEWTGMHFVREAGTLYGPIMTTNSHSVGTVRDAVVAIESRRRGVLERLPVVGETWDGMLNDIGGLHVREEHVAHALDTASEVVAEGSVGGGTGMVCHGFKGGIGTSSRVVEQPAGTYTLGVMVQANHGGREEFEVAGVPVGEMIPLSEVPLGVPGSQDRGPRDPHKNSILIIVATDAPLLPSQCERIAHRATLGVARNGAYGHHLSGDLALAFSTAQHPREGFDFGASEVESLRVLPNSALSPLLAAAMECTQEAILNALVAAETMEGADGFRAFGLDASRLQECVGRYSGPLSPQPPSPPGD
ncbi:P1 family peptidase [Sphaerisporangium sp. NPDC051011]|uniref:DmpA family aminopeptidase n=1 Tax=Sphaerisporangium sp. NPDC051011 TaxID=3155792 RepID=UPI0034041F0D